MNDIAYINGAPVTAKFAETYHTVKSKVALKVRLSNHERSFYLLFVANEQETKDFLKNEKE